MAGSLTLAGTMVLLYNGYMGSEAGVQKMDICTKNISGKLLSVGQFGLRNTCNLSYCPSYANVLTVLRPTWRWLDNCLTMFCQTVQHLDSVVSNSPMVGLCCPILTLLAYLKINILTTKKEAQGRGQDT